jgi:hypothetical protein
MLKVLVAFTFAKYRCRNPPGLNQFPVKSVMCVQTVSVPTRHTSSTRVSFNVTLNTATVTGFPECTCFVCGKAAVLGDRIKGTSDRIEHTLLNVYVLVRYIH